MKQPTKAVDLQGRRFWRLTVLKRVANTKHGKARWLCSCQCGNTIETVGSRLISGATKSCGCLGKEKASIRAKSRVKHGHTTKHSASPTYRSWISMKTRCTNPNGRWWKDYGGRGITVCDRWLNSFEAFLDDMGERPDGKTLDRYPNNDGNYEPGNCRWATRDQQAKSRRLNDRDARGRWAGGLS